MIIETNMVYSLEIGESIESRDISRKSLEAYISGCEELAVRLDTAIEQVGNEGKRPVILIPSRGAVPIFLEAKRFLNELHGSGSPLDSKNARYFPSGVFDYLEEKTPIQPDILTTTDVVLFPFTADVSLESNDDEKLAKELRLSCARSMLHLIKGSEIGKLDYEWYKFLMSKLSTHPKDPKSLDPKKIIESLGSLDVNPDSQIILIDTVISGRAADDITGAFAKLGSPVLPILAVDSVKGVKFDSTRKAAIMETVKDLWQLLPNGNPYDIFVEFPLITEDEGAALLGLMALNFIDFNEDEFFYNISHQFSKDFKPQSCIWTLPPPSSREVFLTNFRQFLKAAWDCKQGNPEQVTNGDIENLSRQSKELTSTHPIPTNREISELVKLRKDAILKESRSHIVSASLPKIEAENWAKEFASQLTRHS